MSKKVKVFNTFLVIACIFACAFSLAIRLYLNFRQELIPGVNGGYYPLQVRQLLEHGKLAFTDMPFLFYLDAFIIKIGSLFGAEISDYTILAVVKVVDSISVPFILLALYQILRLSPISAGAILHVALLFFSVLSISPLILLSDLQKNALAIVFLMSSIAALLAFQKNKNWFFLSLSAAFFLLTGLTHFGTFLFGLFYLTAGLFYLLRKRRLLPVLGLLFFGLLLIGLLDQTRLLRVLTFWTELFDKPALLTGSLQPPDMIQILLSWIIAALGILAIRKKGTSLTPQKRAFLFAGVICLIVLSFPLTGSEYFKRLSLFLFVPSIVTVAILAPDLHQKSRTALGWIFLFVTVLSVAAIVGHPKQPVLTPEAYSDLQRLKPFIKKEKKTIVIARHGLEWWVAWSIGVKIAQDRAFDTAQMKSYSNVYILQQKQGPDTHPENTPFHEPAVAGNSALVYTSAFFKLYRCNTMP